MTLVRGIKIHWDDEGKVADLQILYKDGSVSNSVKTNPVSYNEMGRILEKVYDFFWYFRDPAYYKDGWGDTL